MAIEAGFENRPIDALDFDNSRTKRNRRHAAAEDLPPPGFHLRRHVFPMHMLDLDPELADMRHGIVAAQPEVAGAQIQPKRRRVAFVEQAFRERDVVGNRAVRLEENLDPMSSASRNGSCSFSRTRQTPSESSVTSACVKPHRAICLSWNCSSRYDTGKSARAAFRLSSYGSLTKRKRSTNKSPVVVPTQKYIWLCAKSCTPRS